MSNTFALTLLRITFADIESCRAYLEQHAPGLDVVNETMRRRRARDSDHRKRQLFIRSQIDLEASCSTVDAITLEPISILNRILIGRNCFDALILASYLIERMRDRDASPDVVNFDARNPLTNLPFTVNEIKALDNKLSDILFVYEWVLEYVLRVDPSTLYTNPEI